MESAGTTGDQAAFDVEHIGGIESATVEIPPGVTILAGRNATNRTSFLQAIMAAHGSDWTSVKGSADRGRVELTVDGETYTRTATRTEDGVVGSGSGVLSDPTLANLFAFLLEGNEARQAVVRGDDLREVIMRPVDLAALRREIRDAEQRKAAIDDELDAVASLKQDLPDLEQRRATLRDEIEDVRDELRSVEADIDDRTLDAEITRQNKNELETALDELQATRSELRRVRDEIQSEQESISALRDERGSLAAERASLTDAPKERLEEVKADLTARRERKRDLSEYTTRLQNVIRFNEELLAGEHTQIAEAIGAKPESVGDITDQLYRGSKTTCWTCGSRVKRDRIESTVETMRTHREETLSEIDDIEAALDELSAERDDIETAVNRHEDLSETIAEIDDEIDRRQSTVADLRDRRDNLSSRVAELEARVSSLRSEEFDEVLDLHTEANELEFELDRLESELDELNDEIDEIEAEIRREGSLVEQRKDTVAELIDLRTRIDQLESDATKQFNERMDELLEILGYENLERIWLERTDQPTDAVDQITAEDVVEGSTFELHVVRSSEGGTVYEDTIAHLSESEREVTGLVFALAGYLVHEVHEQVPFMLLDSLEAIDAERIAALVEYFSSYPTYLVVALLPEDAQALRDEYHRVTDIGYSSH
ncbi:chromosome segregation protein SMC [Halomicroarcula sp. S1AR25-4]|uniref:archaea-specific SMC-related protein n=1 Tax=Haloarcula sp. S1AR25-4 TaxID=2950538 RepID=UPI002874D6D8|nr:archaea-specific SMC-related protein [Halomicroarcula sp. S1AR25-4]MDS0279815.1 chromosome segregation protein SMC [Halomicroarcula sp. S1AR25-4]